jgi:hypothetical protein
MDNLLKNVLADIKIGQENNYKNMVIFPLTTDRESTLDFLLLDESLDKNYLKITELSESGTVPELMVVNQSDHKILLLDGEELIGAKQNRVLNVTILLAPNSEIKIPVSCVEAGRWSYSSREFGSASRQMSAELRRKKSESVKFKVRETGSFTSNQGEIWEEIDLKFARCQEPPTATRALSDLFEAKKETTEDYLQKFFPVENQIGVAVFIDGKLAGIELLDKHEKFQKVHKKLVTSYIMDALETVDSIQQNKISSLEDKILDYLTVAMNASLELRPSVALGQDIRLDSDRLMGAGLEFGQQILQLSLFLQRSFQLQNTKMCGYLSEIIRHY